MLSRTTFAVARRLPWRTRAFLADEHTSWTGRHWAPLADAAVIRLERAVPRLTTEAPSERR